VAGLGLAPFRFVGATENVITYPDGTQKPGGTCDYCGTGIRTECVIVSADGKRSKVGCNCISKVGDAGLLRAFKSSPEFRAKQRELAFRKSAIVFSTLQKIIAEKASTLSSMPHPHGFVNRETGDPLSFLDWVNWMADRCGAKGRASLLKRIESM